MRETVIILSITIATTGFAQAAGVADCQVLAESTQRLACYDRLYPPRAATESRGSSVGAVARSPDAPAPSLEATFGLAQRNAGGQQGFIRSEVLDNFEGWDPNQKISLKNGQVWQVIDGSTGTIIGKSKTVTIRRAVLGSYWMEFEGLSKAPKVQRLK